MDPYWCFSFVQSLLFCHLETEFFLVCSLLHVSPLFTNWNGTQKRTIVVNDAYSKINMFYDATVGASTSCDQTMNNKSIKIELTT